MKKLKLWLLKRIAAKNPELLIEALGGRQIESASLRRVAGFAPYKEQNTTIVEFYLVNLDVNDFLALEKAKSFIILP